MAEPIAGLRLAVRLICHVSTQDQKRPSRELPWSCQAAPKFGSKTLLWRSPCAFRSRAPSTRQRTTGAAPCTHSPYPWRLSPRTWTGADEASIVLTRYLALLLTDTYRSTAGPKRRMPQNSVLWSVCCTRLPEIFPEPQECLACLGNDAEDPRAIFKVTPTVSDHRHRTLITVSVSRQVLLCSSFFRHMLSCSSWSSDRCCRTPAAFRQVVVLQFWSSYMCCRTPAAFRQVVVLQFWSSDMCCRTAASTASATPTVSTALTWDCLDWHRISQFSCVPRGKSLTALAERACTVLGRCPNRLQLFPKKRTRFLGRRPYHKSSRCERFFQQTPVLQYLRRTHRAPKHLEGLCNVRRFRRTDQDKVNDLLADNSSDTHFTQNVPPCSLDASAMAVG